MISPSYKDIVKIGKTTKEPEERAKELSSATGVATPFIVVYKREFSNCHLAEKLIHKVLTEKGCRVNNSREFFSIGISEAIDIILEISDSNDLDISNDVETSYESESFSDMYYHQATNYYNGSNNTFQDIDKAFQLYKKSAELGNKEAWLEMGKILYKKNNIKEALNYFHKGSEKGNFCCYAELGKIYMNSSQNYYNKKNAELAWTTFFRSIKNIECDESKISVYLSEFVIYSFLYEEPITTLHELFIAQHIIYIYKSIMIFFNEYSTYDLYESKIAPYFEYLEEKYPFSNNKKEELANLCFNIAKEHLFSYCKSEMLNKRKELAITYYSITKDLDIDGKIEDKRYEQCEIMILRLLNKSLELGNQLANAYIGIYWLYKDYRDKANRNKANTAWRNFYNFIYDTLTDENKNIEEYKEKLLEGLFDIIHTSVERKSNDLLHKYYLIIAAHLHIVEFYSKRIDEMNEFYADYDENDIAKQIIFCQVIKVDEERIKIVHTRMKEFLEEVRQSGNLSPLAYRLEDE